MCSESRTVQYFWWWNGKYTVICRWYQACRDFMNFADQKSKWNDLQFDEDKWKLLHIRMTFTKTVDMRKLDYAAILHKNCWELWCITNNTSLSLQVYDCLIIVKKGNIPKGCLEGRAMPSAVQCILRKLRTSWKCFCKRVIGENVLRSRKFEKDLFTLGKMDKRGNNILPITHKSSPQRGWE